MDESKQTFYSIEASFAVPKWMPYCFQAWGRWYHLYEHVRHCPQKLDYEIARSRYRPELCHIKHLLEAFRDGKLKL